LATIYIDSKHSDSLAVGKAYESRIVYAMKTLYSIVLHIFEDKYSQYYVGENGEGYEIKLDQHIQHSQRMSIEIGEKQAINRKDFTPSGIFREDNTVFYVQGFNEFAWLFWKSDLRQYFHQNNPPLIDNDPQTIQKFYISRSLAQTLSLHRFALSDQGIAWYDVCQYGIPPCPEWSNCEPCPCYEKPHCNSKGGKEMQLYLRRRDTIAK